LKAGVPAVDLIDFDYPPWHTAADTLDKTSGHSLKIVGDVVYFSLPEIDRRCQTCPWRKTCRGDALRGQGDVGEMHVGTSSPPPSAATLPSDEQLQPGHPGEVSKVRIAGHECHVVIETALGDQRVRQPRSAPPPDQLRPQAARPLPVAVRDGKQRQAPKQDLDAPRELGIAEELGQNDGRQTGLTVGEQALDDGDVGALCSGEVRDPGARIDRDQRRSFRSSLQSTENATRPRSLRRSS